MKTEMPSYLNFDAGNYAWKPGIDYRKEPEKYKVGKGEQGVLICEPYKNEIGQHWRFKTVEIAKESSNRIYEMFLNYVNQGDFVGADMARKYLQMGFTRARRYANYKGGKKYDNGNDYKLLRRGTGDAEKAAAAAIFFQCWKSAEANEYYHRKKRSGKNQGIVQPYEKEYKIIFIDWDMYLLEFWHNNYILLSMKTNATKTKSINSADLVSAIDKQLQTILAKDIRKIDNVNIRGAAFLALIAA